MVDFFIAKKYLKIKDGVCKDSRGETLLHYYDRGPFYDRTVIVDKINITLE